MQPKISHKLLDTIKSEHQIEKDSELARALGLSKAQISEMRYGVAKVTPNVILKIHEKMHFPVARIRQLIAQHNRV